jgi:hypothetical protein
VANTTYRILSGDQAITNAMNRPLTDEDEAKRLAQEVSEGQPDATITVVSTSTEPAGEWTRTVATFVDGKPHPWLWTVTFVGQLMDADHRSLSAADISYARGGSEVADGGIRAGVARHEVLVGAASADAAMDAVRDALAARSPREFTDWTAVPAEDESSRAEM